MAALKTTEVRKLSDAEISEQIKDTRRELFDLRFQQATRQLTNTHRFKESRIKLARLISEQNERSRSKSSS